MRAIALVFLLPALAAGLGKLPVSPAGETDAPWWSRFPVYVGDVGAGACDARMPGALHASVVSGNYGADPGWGPYAQRVSFLESAGRFRKVHGAGIRWITWMEAFGETMLYAAALERRGDGSFLPRPDDPGVAALVRHAWNWESSGRPGGNVLRWVGLHNVIEDEDFIRPRFERKRLGFPVPRYPGGREALGKRPGASYPLDARVYDAVCVKDINGRLAVRLGLLPKRANQVDLATGTRKGPVEGLYGATIDRNRTAFFPARKTGEKVYASILFLGKDPAAPFWTAYARVMARELIRRGVDGLWCDNYSCFNNFGMPPVHNGFGEWSEHTFRRRLAGWFTAGELRRLGIDDAGKFDIKAYLKRKAAAWGARDAGRYRDPAWHDPRWMDEPIWNAYKVFKQQVGQEALHAFYAAVKDEARRQGRGDFLVAGNDMPVYGLGWARDTWLDMVSSEQTPGWNITTGSRGILLPPKGKYAVVYRAALEHQKGPYATVWYYLKGPYEKYRNRPELATVLWAEGFANATFLKYGGNPALPGTAESASWWNGFVRSSEKRFGRRTLLADVGLYFSPDNQLAFVVPGSHALDHDRQPHSFGHWGFGTALIDAHVPYRVVTDWKLSAATLAGLKTFILPGAECLDDAQVTVIEQWVRGGGHLRVTGPCGARRATAGRFARRRTPLVLRWFPATPADVPAQGSTPGKFHRDLGRGSITWSPQPIGMEYYLRDGERTRLLPQVIEFTGGSSVLDAHGLASTVGLFPWRSKDRGALFADLVNYDIDLETDKLTPATKVAFRLRLPAGWREVSVETITPEGTRPATCRVEAGWAAIQMDRLVHYASVKLSGSAGRSKERS